MDNPQLLEPSNNSNLLPMVKHGKCEGCSAITKDAEVLCCYLCKKHFHATNCTVTETLGSDALPSHTNLTNYSKFGSKSYPTGRFIWTCFRCGSIEELASRDNLSERVSLLEALLVTLSPALSSLTNALSHNNDQGVEALIANIRASTAQADDGNSINTDEVTKVLPSGVSNINSEKSAEMHQDNERNTSASVPLSLVGTNSNRKKQTQTPGYASQGPPSKKAGAKMRIRVVNKEEVGPPLRAIFHRAHLSGKIGSYTIRYHSNHKADLLFDNIKDAETAHHVITSELVGVEVSSPSHTNTKMVHIVGLTEDDTKQSVYDAICKPGRNSAIEHLVNPYTLRVLDVKPCNKKQHVYRATIVISEDIWDIISNEMNEKLKVDYLSCAVYLRPDSIRCYRCQHLGHTAQTCQNEIACVNCGGSHESNGCPNPAKCINCSGSENDCNHRADASDCPAFRNYRKGDGKK